MSEAEEKREAAKARVAELVRNFRRNEADYLAPSYNETQARTDFITPLLAAFGWDVYNEAGQASGLREVVEEATVEVGEERLSKKPDYELRVARQRKMFVEAKKPSVRIDRDRAPAFQTRRYGYSGSLSISILTNFRQLAVYDCLPVPSDTDAAHVARIALFSYEEFEERFDELWDILSRDSVYSGEFDRRFAAGITRQGTQQFDDLFLSQVRAWRERLAADIYANTAGLTSAELTYVVQLFLSRIVFLRICEDRDLEKYETLRSLDAEQTFAALITVLKRADEFYDSGLFRLLDDERLGVRISDSTIRGIIEELYYPQSPYTFAVVEAEVLGEIYEQFLGEVVTVSAGAVEIVSRPEVRESGGVVPTPRYIVDAVVERTLAPALAGKSPSDLADFTVADICCGSGIFLLAAYELLLDHYLSWYLDHDRAAHVGRTIYEVTAGHWRLTFDERRRVLTRHLFGVDIDAEAVEVARFSLLLKLIENETAAGLEEFVRRSQCAALPSLDAAIKCGNSLVSQPEWVATGLAFPRVLRDQINPLTWAVEFPDVMHRGGFNVIVGNPPYIRIQNMTTYSPEEVAFYKHPASPYTTAQQDNFDKYALFIERSVSLLHPDGRIGVIVPHKFMTIQAGRTLRRLISVGQLLEGVVHFGVKQVFGSGTTNYTCILILDRRMGAQVRLERVGILEEWRYGRRGDLTEIPAAALTEEAWEFANPDTRTLFDKVRAEHPDRLGQLAEIFVGVQTSADAIYIFRPIGEEPDFVVLEWNGREWPIERAILRPCLHDVPLAAYTRPQANTWMIFPYELIRSPRGVQARLIQPRAMAGRFPCCWAYLNARHGELEDRSITGGGIGEHQWYQFGRSQSLTKFDGPKIILPVLSREPRYAYDDSDIVVTGGGNGPYYMIRPRAGSPITNLYLLAVLNHPLSEAFVRTYTSPFRGGYYSHGKQFIENLSVPIPAPTDAALVERLVGEAIDASEALRHVRTPQQHTIEERRFLELKAEIENKITTLFGLDETEVRLAQAVPIPS